MIVYELVPEMTRHTFLAAVPESDIRAVADLDGTPMADRWQPITVEPILGEFPELTRVGDLTDLGAVPVLSARAVEVLERDLLRHRELLPLRAPALEMPYYVYNVTTVLDALDRTSTIAEWLDTNRLLAVDRYGFHDTKLVDATIFKIPELRRRTVFVTDRFVDQVRGAKLLGFAPRMVFQCE